MEISGFSIQGSTPTATHRSPNTAKVIKPRKESTGGRGRNVGDDEEKRREGKMEERSGEEKQVSQEALTNPTRMTRAKGWSEEVEENFRLQTVGWRDIYEYRAHYGEPDRWEQNGFVKCLRVKKNGYYSYWRPHREIQDKYIGQVKLYEY